MKFTLTTSRNNYEDYPNEIEKLTELGFSFDESWIEEDIEIEINTLEELIELSEKVGFELIVDKNSIEIYNGWRE